MDGYKPNEAVARHGRARASTAAASSLAGHPPVLPTSYHASMPLLQMRVVPARSPEPAEVQGGVPRPLGRENLFRVAQGRSRRGRQTSACPSTTFAYTWPKLLPSGVAEPARPSGERSASVSRQHGNNE